MSRRGSARPRILGELPARAAMHGVSSRPLSVSRLFKSLLGSCGSQPSTCPEYPAVVRMLQTIRLPCGSANARSADAGYGGHPEHPPCGTFDVVACGVAEWPDPTGETIRAFFEPQHPGNPLATIKTTAAERLARLGRTEPGPGLCERSVTCTDPGNAKKPKGMRRQHRLRRDRLANGTLLG